MKMLRRRSTLQSYGSFSNLLEEEEEKDEQQQQQHRKSRGGGRRPGKLDETTTSTKTTEDMKNTNQQEDDGDDDDDDWYLQPSSSEEETRLIIVQITDVYTLDNFASLKTLLMELRQVHNNNNNTKIISVLTGDFLSPYLLSSIDRGRGMMEAIVSTPIDYLIWGNHEADIDHETVCRHVEYYHNNNGTWLNTNMQSHEAMEFQKPYDIIELNSSSSSSSSGTNNNNNNNSRRVGLVAVLSNDPDLYSHFKNNGAFGGATIDDPWETLKEYKEFLQMEKGCDVIIPLQHLYVPDDKITCHQFDFPVILSGHDHHKVDQIVDGTRLIKPGMDGIYATILELSWKNNSSAGSQPDIRSTFVPVSNWSPCPSLQVQTNRAYDVLVPLRNTQLMNVLPQYEPLSSVNARGCVCTMGVLICSLLKAALNSKNSNTTTTSTHIAIDAVILMGGNIRGGTDYPLGSFFSLEMLEAEIKSDEVVGIVPIPGYVLAEGILCTHAGDPKPGWMQYDDGISIAEDVIAAADDNSGNSRRRNVLTHVNGQPFDRDRIYTVATKISDLGNGQSPPFQEYFTQHPEGLPAKGSYFNIPTELMGFVARHLFRNVLWEASAAASAASNMTTTTTTTKKKKEQQELTSSSLSTTNAVVKEEETPNATTTTIAQPASSSEETTTATKTTAHPTDDDNESNTTATTANTPPSTIQKTPSSSSLPLFELLDQDGDGCITVEEIHMALRDILGLSVHPEEMTLATYIHAYADRTGNGLVTRDDLELFFMEEETKTNNRMAKTTTRESSSWDAAFPHHHHHVVGAAATTNNTMMNHDDSSMDMNIDAHESYEEALTF